MDLRSCRLFAVALAWCGGAVAAPLADATAQSPPAEARRIAAVRVEGEAPRPDGRLDEPAWSTAPVASGFVQREPSPGAPVSEPVEARVLYDDEAVYVGMRLHDDPSRIAAPLVRRDASALNQSDWAYVMLDSGDDNRTAFVFAANPRGVQKDYLVYNDSREDGQWDAVWSVGTRVDSAGWTAEFRIPLSQLRFSPADTAWGANFGRWLARNGEWSFWAPWLPDRPGYVSQFGTLTGLRGLPAPRRLELLPYSVARLVREPGDGDDPFHRPNDLGGSLGMDLRYGVSADFALTATVNPDFGQVEGDPAQVNLTAFETRFSERRPFFLEGTDIFDFGLLGGGSLFYSRRIGRAPQGSPPGDARFEEVPEATTILGAVKLSGKTSSGWSIGVLEALTSPETGRFVDTAGTTRDAPVEPAASYTVARAIRDFRGGESALGAIATATFRRIDGDGLDFLPSTAVVGGVDGRHRFAGGDYEVRGYVVGSLVQGSAASITRLQRRSSRYFQRPDAGHVELDPARTALEGSELALSLAKLGGNWRWEAEATARSPEFEANDLGFQTEADRLTQNLEVTYESFDAGRVFRRWEVELIQGSDWTFAGERLETFAGAFGSFQLTSYWGGRVELVRGLSALSVSELRGGPALRVPGGWGWELSLNSDRRRAVSGDVSAEVEMADDGGRSVALEPEVDWRPTSQMEVSLGVSAEWSRNPWQYVTQQAVAGARHYFFAELRQSEVSLEARVNYTFAPGLTLQVFAEPFLSAGRYRRFAGVADPRAAAASRRFRPFAPGQVVREEGEYRLDLDGDGGFDTGFRDPDFHVGSLRSNAVLRWEYRPGSTLFVVWTQDRGRRSEAGRIRLGDDVGDLFGYPGTDVLLVKASYRIGS